MSARNDCPHGMDAGAYVLDALEPNEREAFERHLRGCEDCRAEVAELRVAAEALPLAAHQVHPPPALKQRLMDIVREEASVLAAAGPEADRPPAAAAAVRPAAAAAAATARGAGADAGTPERSGAGRRDAWWRRRLIALRPLPAAGLAAALLALGVAGGVLLRGGEDERVVTAQVTAPDANARVVVAGDHGRLEVSGLPAPSKGDVYQVWVQRRDAAPQPTDALFRTTRQGRASVDVPGTLEGVQRVMVTAEPDGGSAAPTSEPVVVATVS